MTRLTFTSNRFQSFFRVAGLVVIGCSGYWIALASRYSLSTNDSDLFLSLVPITTFNFVAVGVYFWWTRDVSRWLALAVCVFALFSVGELALRVL
jgi:hypothetical protein